jgi:hypothetical protein
LNAKLYLQNYPSDKIGDHGLTWNIENENLKKEMSNDEKTMSCEKQFKKSKKIVSIGY